MPNDPLRITTPDAGPHEPWLTCVAPLVVFLGVGFLEPTASGGGLADALGIPLAAHPVIYCVRVLAAGLVLLRLLPNLRTWLGQPTWWPPILGLALVIPWVILASLQREAGWTFGMGERSGYDPFDGANLGSTPSMAWAFLVIRSIGLVVMVPIAEELFVRGFLMRYAIAEQFWRVPFGALTLASATACMVYAVASHPAEAVAAIGWFAVVSGVAAATRKPIDCILCHAATNLALGAYVLTTHAWWLV